MDGAGQRLCLHGRRHSRQSEHLRTQVWAPQLSFSLDHLTCNLGMAIRAVSLSLEEVEKAAWLAENSLLF